MNFIHIPKTGGTSVRETLWGATQTPHKRIRDYPEVLKEETFTVVRNPFDRAVSIFGHLHRHKKIVKEEFTNWVEGGSSPRLYKKYDIKLADPMVDWLVYNGRVAVDHVIRFENLEEEFEELFHKPLLKVNVGKRERGYRQYYTDSTKDIIATRYAEDIALFNYEY